MGTRSLTYVYKHESDSEPFVCMYCQFDGYPKWHGKELAEFLIPIEVVSGFTLTMQAGTHANGMGCLAAQMVQHFKDMFGIGGIYLQAPDLETDSGQEYEYHVWENRVKVIDCYSGGDGVLFDGTWKELGVFTGAESLRDLLSEGVVRVTFIKADGSKRVMNCTTNFDLMPEDAAPKSSMWMAVTDPDLYKVFDVDLQGWRSFRKERVEDFSVVPS